jgi:glycosyltransferase involved in cell wall biosynthesis
MISILMPIYNGIEFIEESVSSILRQNYDQWELLIGINGHPQNSNIYKTAKEYEKKSGKIRVFDFYEIKGKSNTLNVMIRFCNYNYVALLDVDDIWHDEKLNVQSQLLNHYDVIGSNCVWFGDRAGIVPPIPVGDISKYDFSSVNPIINSSSIIRKELCYWNSNWDGIEDYDLWIRLRKQNKKFFNCKAILVKHRIHNTSAFNAKGNDNKVDSLLVSHGFKTRAERQNDTTRIEVPVINKIKMNLF